jgi:magnesium transporter
MSHWAYLYDADGSDARVEINDIAIAEITDKQLLWIDASCDSPSGIAEIAPKLPISDDAVRRIFDEEKRHRLDNYGTYFAFGVDLPDPAVGNAGAGLPAQGKSLAFMVGDRWILTIHDKDVGYLTAFQAQDKGETAIGLLSPSLLAASLLDWHLAIEIDAIDEHILTGGADREGLSEIVQARRGVSNLRKLVSKQRQVFHGLTRPDFAINTDDRAAAQFKALADRYDRAVDEVERTRDLVIGSFELFASMSSEETNDLVKALTFVTVVIGFSAAVAGLLGMNFDAPFFKSGLTGFILASSALAGMSVVAVLVARQRRWI